MMSRSTRGSVAAMGLLTALAHAQPASTPPSRPDPLEARSPVSPATHRSALATWRAPGDTAVGSWNDANTTVNRIGGWRAYAREAAEAPAPAAVPAAAPASPPTKAPAPPSAAPSPRPATEAGPPAGAPVHRHDHGAPRK